MFGTLCHSHRRIGFRAVTLAAAVLLSTCRLASAQPADVRPLDKANPDNTLFLIVRFGPSETEQSLRDKLKIGLNAARCQYEEPIEMQALSPVLYEELARLIGRGGIAAPLAKSTNELQIRPLPLRGQTWEVRLPKEKQLIRQLTIKYRNAGDKKYTTKATDESERLTLIVPGSYAVQLLPNDEPLEYTTEVEELGGKSQTATNKWPETDRFYSLTIRKFKGDQEALFKVLQDKTEVANPFTYIEPIRNFSFAFANLNSKAGMIEKTIMEGNNYRPQIPGVDGRETKRVWMQFPLTKEEAFKGRAALRKQSLLELPQAIRKSGKTLTNDAQAPAIDAKSEPRWYELIDQKDGRGFTGSIPMKDFRELQEKYQQGFYRLLVWEFDKSEEGKAPQAIEVQHPTDGGRVLVVEEEIKALPAQIAIRAGNAPKTPDKKPKEK